MSSRSRMRCGVAIAAILLSAPAFAQAQVYKWVDEKGTVNYGNKPPAASRGGKAPTVVEDRVSVYTTDPRVAQATQNARDRSGLPNTYTSAPTLAQPDRPSGPAFSGAAPPPPAPAVGYDPCANPSDPNCLGYPAYPGYARHYRPPHLVQPQLQPGAIAGNVNAGNGYIPGLSSQAQPPATPAPSMMRQRGDGTNSGSSFGGSRDDDRAQGQGRGRGR